MQIESNAIPGVTCDFVAPAVQDLTEKLAPFGILPNSETLEIIKSAMAELARRVWAHRQTVINEFSSARDDLQCMPDDSEAKNRTQVHTTESDEELAAQKAEISKKFARCYKILAGRGQT